MGHVSPPYVGHILGHQIVRILTARVMECRRPDVTDKLSAILDQAANSKMDHPRAVTCDRLVMAAGRLVAIGAIVTRPTRCGHRRMAIAFTKANIVERLRGRVTRRSSALQAGWHGGLHLQIKYSGDGEKTDAKFLDRVNVRGRRLIRSVLCWSYVRSEGPWLDVHHRADRRHHLVGCGAFSLRTHAMAGGTALRGGSVGGGLRSERPKISTGWVTCRKVDWRDRRPVAAWRRLRILRRLVHVEGPPF